MSKNGWEFIAPALKKEGLSFTHACVRIDDLSAEVARIENEIVDVGVEMGQLDYRDREAIEKSIEKYKALRDR